MADNTKRGFFSSRSLAVGIVVGFVLFIVALFALGLPSKVWRGEDGHRAIQMLDAMRRPFLKIKEAEAQLIESRLIENRDAKTASAEFTKEVESADALLMRYEQLAAYNSKVLVRVAELKTGYESWVSIERHLFNHISENKIPGSKGAVANEHFLEHLNEASIAFLKTMDVLGSGEAPIHDDIDAGRRAVHRLLGLSSLFFFYLIGLVFYHQNRRIIELKRSHGELKEQIEMRKQAEDELKEYRDHLEVRVEERTKELSREIAERKQIEEAIRVSEDRYRGVIDNIGIGVSLISQNMEVLTLNKQMQRWFPSIDTSKKPICYKVFNDPPGKERCSYCPTYDSLKDGQVHESETETPAGDKVRNYRIVASPLKDREGNIVAAIEMVEDITERKRAEEEKEELQAQLIQAQKMEAVGTMAGGIAHDFNNIMTVVKTMTHVALSKTGDNLELKECLEPILNVSDRAIKLIEQLLTFSQRKPIKLESINLNDTIDDLLDMLRTLLSEDISIEKDLKYGLWNIEGDKGRIEQVATNLVVNSSNAMPDGGKITLHTKNITLTEEQSKAAHGRASGNFVCLMVEDTGTGMDKETIKHIFEPFFTTNSPSGTGLGLSVVYGIVNELKGWVDVSSEPGQGTKFMVYLPASMESKETVAGEPVKKAAVHGGGKRILLVEDEELVRKSTVMVLSDYGYVVCEAEDAEEAISLFSKEKGEFDLVLSDITMPGISGLQMVKPLLDINPNISVLFFSGHIDDKANPDQITKDGFAYIQKPYDIPDLLYAIQESIKGNA